MLRNDTAVIWVNARNPLMLELRIDGELASVDELGGITRWALELRRYGQSVLTVDQLIYPSAFALGAGARLTVDLSDIDNVPTGLFVIRLYSYDSSDDDPIIWLDGEVSLEIRD
jgi:hypothetical protein